MQRLFKPIDIASLVFFRIVFGVLAFADVVTAWTYKHFYKASFQPEGFQFNYYGFEWVQPLPEPFMSFFFILALGASIGILIGWRYRWCATFFAFSFTYIFLLEKAYYLNHGYLFCILSYLMILLPAHYQFSIDALRKRVPAVQQIPAWPILLLKFSMAIVYFFGGIAKINEDWLHAYPLKIWLKAKSDMPLLGGLWSQEWVAWLMSYGGLFLDLFVVFFLLSKRTRKWALLFIVFFHGTNVILFQIGIFPWLSLALSLLFFEPDFPRKVLHYVYQKIPKLAFAENWWDKQSLLTTPLPPPPSSQQQKWIGCAFAIYALFHIAMPVRHHYFKGPVAWTEEGHRYSWRMMLRSKRGYGHFKVIDKESGEQYWEDGKDYLNKRQTRKLYTHPDMILQFAHFLEDQYEAKGMEVEIYASVKAKLNGRPYQAFIVDTVDLTQVQWSFFEESDWIVPFKDRPIIK